MKLSLFCKKKKIELSNYEINSLFEFSDLVYYFLFFFVFIILFLNKLKDKLLDINEFGIALSEICKRENNKITKFFDKFKIKKLYFS